RLLVAALGVALAAVYVPMSLFRLVDADEGIYLLNAKEVLNGSLPYHDFFYPQMPLLPYVYGLWMKLFGVSWYSGRLLSALLAIDTRLYLVVVIPLLLVHLVRSETEGRRLQLARFAVGLVVALLPNEFFLLMDPGVFLFNVLGVHGIRSPFGLVGLVSQKVDLLTDLLGV